MTERASAQPVPEMVQKFETTVAEGLHTWTDLTRTATEFAFDQAGHSLRFNLQVLAAYRQLSQDQIKTWQSYVEQWGQFVKETTTPYFGRNGA